MRKLLQKCSILLAILILSCTYLFRSPTQCSLCTYLPCHAPCLVNLSTGEIGELSIYEPHPTKVGMIAELQSGGTFGFLSCAGLKAQRNTDAQTIQIQIPLDSKPMNRFRFCRSCRTRLKNHHGQSFVLADLSEPNAPILYPVDQDCTIRCYLVHTAQCDNSLTLYVQGTLY